MIYLRRITGVSMEPAFRDGQLVIIRGVKKSRVKSGDVVMFLHNNIEKIKRVHEFKDNSLWLLGDNLTLSTDSRSFGYVSTDQLVGKLIFPYAQHG